MEYGGDPNEEYDFHAWRDITTWFIFFAVVALVCWIGA